MQKRYSHFIDNCHAYLKASSPLISFARNANSQLLQRRKECQKKIPPSTTIKPSPPCLFKTITDFTALFLDLPNSTRLDNSNFVFPFDSFVYVRCRDGWHAGETIDTCPACETFLLFDDSYAVTPPRLRLPHLRPSETEGEENSRPTPSPTRLWSFKIPFVHAACNVN